MAWLTAGTILVLKVSHDPAGSVEIDNAGSPQVHLSATWLEP